MHSLPNVCCCIPGKKEQMQHEIKNEKTSVNLIIPATYVALNIPEVCLFDSNLQCYAAASLWHAV